MIVELGRRLTTFGQTEPGTLIRFAAASTEYLAIKVRTEKQEAEVLKPGHERWNGRPGIRCSRWGEDETVFDISGAIFRPDVNHVELADSRLHEPGHVVIDGNGRPFLVVRANPGQAGTT